MIFFYNASGTLIKVAPEHVYQGSDGATTLYFVAPIVGTAAVNVAFTLPNGERTAKHILTPVTGELNGVTDGDGNTYKVWAYDLDGYITAIAGTVEAQFFITISGVIRSTQAANFTVELGVPPVIEPPEGDSYDEIMDYIQEVWAQLQANIDEKQDALSETQLNAVNSGIDSAKVAKIGTNETAIEDINAKIPSAASSSNKLVDTAQMQAFALPITTKYGANLSLAFNSVNGQLTAQLKDQDGNNLGQAQTVPVPIDLQSLENTINNILALIPPQASPSNQLADKEFVNSSISTNTAHFLGDFTSLAELNAYTGTVTNNDYANVIRGVSGQTFYDRYTYNANTGSWVFNFTVNNTTFTSAQWDAINSGMTSVLRTAYGNHIANTSNPHSVTKSQVGLSYVDNVRQYSDNNPNFGTSAPLMDGTAAVGTATTYSRSDHAHPSDTSKQDKLSSSVNIKTVNGASILGAGNLSVFANSFMRSIVLRGTDGKITVNLRCLSNVNTSITTLSGLYNFLASTNGQLALLTSSFIFNDNSITTQGEYVLSYATISGNYIDLGRRTDSTNIASWLIGKNESGWEVFGTVTQMAPIIVS